MKRLTRLAGNNEHYVTDSIEGKDENEGYYGEAVEKLAKFEDFYDHLVVRQDVIPKELEKLRSEGKSKTFRYKELFAEKLMNEVLLDQLRARGLK